MSAISDVRAWMAIDSRGVPTVAVHVRTSNGEGLAIAPAGASTGAHEARELRDDSTAWGGRGVTRAVAQVNDGMAAVLMGVDPADPWAVDEVLDSSAPEGGWGGNASVATTLAALLAAADERSMPLWRWVADVTRTAQPTLPMPMVNIVSGGAHAGRAVDIQDVLAIPVGARSFSEAIEMTASVRRCAAQLAGAHAPELSVLVADEGGVAAPPGSNRDAIALVRTAITDSGLTGQVEIAVDVAATQFLTGDRYVLAADEVTLSGGELARELASWATEFGIVSVEDPFAEDDWDSWSGYADSLSTDQVIGDDLIATNRRRLERAFEGCAANTVLVKVNQAGTVARAFDVLTDARRLGMKAVVSARSGETEQDWLADLAVGAGAGQIKVGSTHRSERTAKWNRLLALEALHGDELAFAGRAALASRADFNNGGQR
jgi:enolase